MPFQQVKQWITFILIAVIALGTLIAEAHPDPAMSNSTQNELPTNQTDGGGMVTDAPSSIDEDISLPGGEFPPNVKGGFFAYRYPGGFTCGVKPVEGITQVGIGVGERMNTNSYDRNDKNTPRIVSMEQNWQEGSNITEISCSCRNTSTEPPLDLEITFSIKNLAPSGGRVALVESGLMSNNMQNELPRNQTDDCRMTDSPKNTSPDVNVPNVVMLFFAAIAAFASRQ